MSASNRRDLITQTLSEYLKGRDENPFDNIIENGDEFIEELSARFEKERSQDVKLSIIILAREIRTKYGTRLTLFSDDKLDPFFTIIELNHFAGVKFDAVRIVALLFKGFRCSPRISLVRLLAM